MTQDWQPGEPLSRWEPLRGRPHLASVNACEREAWSVALWPRSGPSDARQPVRIPFRCGSWRCRRCAAWRGAVDFRRCAAGVTSRPWWVYAVLTFDPRLGTDQWEAFRTVGKMWDDSLRESLRAKVGRFEYLQTWERTLRGWPHVNLVLSGDQLRSWVEGDGVVRRWHPRARRECLLPQRWRRWFRDAAVRAGFGKVVWAEVLAPTARQAMAGYLCKLSAELVGAAGKKGDQSPVQAPPHFRRFRASRGLLPPPPKGKGEWTGTLLPGRCVAMDSPARRPGERPMGEPISWETVAAIQRRMQSEAADMADRWNNDGQSDLHVQGLRESVQQPNAPGQPFFLGTPRTLEGSGPDGEWTAADAAREAARW